MADSAEDLDIFIRVYSNGSNDSRSGENSSKCLRRVSDPGSGRSFFLVPRVSWISVAIPLLLGGCCVKIVLEGDTSC